MPRSSRVLTDPNPQSDLVQFKYLGQYGVGRTKAFEKSTAGGPRLRPRVSEAIARRRSVVRRPGGDPELGSDAQGIAQKEESRVARPSITQQIVRFLQEDVHSPASLFEDGFP